MNCEEFLEARDILIDAEAGRASIPAALLEELRRHARDCPRCRSEAEETRGQEEALRRLLALTPGPAPGLERWSPPPRAEGLWLPILAAAAAAVLAAVLIPAPRAPSPAPIAGPGVEAERGGAWGPVVAKEDIAGLRIRASRARSWVRPGEGIEIAVEAGTILRIEGPGRVALEEGAAAARVRRGASLAIATPLAEVSAEGSECFVRAVRGRSGERKEPGMSSLRSAGVAAAVSVVVAAGTVYIVSPRGSASVGSGEAALVEEGKAPQVTRLADALDGLRQDVEDLKKSVGGLEKSIETRVVKIEKRVEEVVTAAKEAKPKGAEGGAATKEGGGAPAADEVAKDFEKFAKLGPMAYADPGLGELAKKLSAMGDEGRGLLADQLSSDSASTRFVAAAVAEKMKDPGLIPDLRKAALEDEDFLVRRMSSHALAFMESDEAGDALVEVLKKETGDVGVKLNAWYGLASLKRAEAVELFDGVLDAAGGDIPPDLVVDTALKVTTANPGLLPALRKAYDRSTVSTPLKVRILQVLGKAPGGEYAPFLQGVMADPATSETLRKAAGGGE
jgi:hypothetical protein